MTAASHDVPTPPHLGRRPGPAREAANDDALIEKLRARAWDPGRRFDEAHVPGAWIAERYGTDWLGQSQDGRRGSCSDGTIAFKSLTEVVAAYYADAPRGPLFAPVTLAQVEDVERRLGLRLPELLRRVYTEVADGGFGPDCGLVSLCDGNRAPGHLSDWPSAARARERNRAAGVPESWFELTAGGCSMYWHVSLLAVDNPVLLYDCDRWVPEWGEDPHDGLSYAAESLRKWLWTWADGGNVWREVLDR
ncbi:SMI1/KNR4 family protein [Kitasatospora sp. NPDC087314]|uniref:SMI1/KNR4 family protein n=1 Tax=Kitasatospora sp. NPDC087314 TaxID=3364068 RepID=UPI003803C7D9